MEHEPEIVRERPKSSSRDEESDWTSLLIVLLAIVGLGLGAALKGIRDARPGRLPVRPREEAVEGAPAEPEVHLLKPADAGADADARAVVSFLEKAAGTEIGPAFAAEFLKDPELRKKWSAFGERLRQEPAGAVRAFALDLASSPKFGDLVVRFGPEPGFKELVLDAARIPAVADALAKRAGVGLAVASPEEGLARSPDASADEQPPADEGGSPPHEVNTKLSRPGDIKSEKDTYDKHSLWSKMQEKDRDAVLKILEKSGGTAREACRRAGKSAQCAAAVRACKQDRECDASEFEE